MTALARPFVSVAVACVLAFGLPVTTTAQPAAQGGRLTGRVTDGSGAALPGVAVTLRGAGAPAPVTVVTDGVGLYTTPPLPARLYTVTFELTGFASRTRQDVEVRGGDVFILDQQLGLASLVETVEVVAAAPATPSSPSTRCRCGPRRGCARRSTTTRPRSSSATTARSSAPRAS